MLSASFKVGGRIVEPAKGRVLVGGRWMRLEPRLMRLLLALANARGDVVSKEDLFATAWTGAEASDESLTSAIYRLRRILGGGKPCALIENLPKRGYRLAEDIEDLSTAADGGNDKSAGQTATELIARGSALLLTQGSWCSREARPVFSRVIVDDPNCASAHAGLGAVELAAAWANATRGSDALDAARTFSFRALALDPMEPLALATLAIIEAFFEGRVSQASGRLRLAFERRGDNVFVLRAKALLAAALGEFDTAVDAIQIAVQIDPCAVSLLRDSAHILLITRRYRAAHEAADALERLVPNAPDVWLTRGWAHQFAGDNSGAFCALLRAFVCMGFGAEEGRALTAAMERGGLPAVYSLAYAALCRRAPNWEPQSTDLGILAAQAGEKARAMAQFLAAERQGAPMLAFAAYAPHFDCLRGEKWFEALIRRRRLALAA